MKRILTIAIIALASKVAISQTWEVKYEYDNAGNRKNRKMVEIPIGSNKSAQLEEVEPITDSWDEREVIVYPNPTKGNLKVSISGGNPDDKYTYAIYDSAGKIILKGRITKLGEYPFKLQRYNAGIYFLVLECNSDKKTYKIIKE